MHIDNAFNTRKLQVPQSNNLGMDNCDMVTHYTVLNFNVDELKKIVKQ
jgi:hypothetical protein